MLLRTASTSTTGIGVTGGWTAPAAAGVDERDGAAVAPAGLGCCGVAGAAAAPEPEAAGWSCGNILLRMVEKMLMSVSVKWADRLVRKRNDRSQPFNLR